MSNFTVHQTEKGIAKMTQLADKEAKLPTFGSLDAAVQADIDAGLHFGASLLVARGGKVVHRANLGAVAPNRPAKSDDRARQLEQLAVFVHMAAHAAPRSRQALAANLDSLRRNPVVGPLPNKRPPSTQRRIVQARIVAHD